jgi:asparagine N-glycosylation enzyme membrane subunit Stt3
MKPPGHQSEFSVWFYIGGLLLVYGFLLLAAGIYQLSHPPTTVLASYHPTLWGGVVLLFLGALYTFIFWPSRSPRKR